MKTAFFRMLAAGILFAISACNPTHPHHGASTKAVSISEFEQLELRLLNASEIKFDFTVSAEGAVEADIHGAFELKQGKYISLSGVGSFGGEQVKLTLRADQARLTLSNGLASSDIVRPQEIDEALIVGLTRMGILHNLAQLMGGAPPDHSSGGVKEWVVVSMQGVKQTNPTVSMFDLIVGSEPSGSASLEIDANGAPVRRMQTVSFPTGEMRVVERYSNLVIQP